MDQSWVQQKSLIQSIKAKRASKSKKQVEPTCLAVNDQIGQAPSQLPQRGHKEANRDNLGLPSDIPLLLLGKSPEPDVRQNKEKNCSVSKGKIDGKQKEVGQVSEMGNDPHCSSTISEIVRDGIDIQVNSSDDDYHDEHENNTSGNDTSSESSEDTDQGNSVSSSDYDSDDKAPFSYSEDETGPEWLDQRSQHQHQRPAVKEKGVKVVSAVETERMNLIRILRT